MARTRRSLRIRGVSWGAPPQPTCRNRSYASMPPSTKLSDRLEASPQPLSKRSSEKMKDRSCRQRLAKACVLFVRDGFESIFCAKRYRSSERTPRPLSLRSAAGSLNKFSAVQRVCGRLSDNNSIRRSRMHAKVSAAKASTSCSQWSNPPAKARCCSRSDRPSADWASFATGHSVRLRR
jgi:hypothetical protein